MRLIFEMSLIYLYITITEYHMINWDGTISLLLACTEFILLINLFVFAEKNKINKIAMLLISLLAIYQLLEFLMCTLNLKYSYMAYFAFVTISFMPPLNFIFVFKHFHREMKWHKLVFLPAVFFAVYYFFVIEKFAVTACSALYASYSYPLGTLFGLFYYLPLLISIVFLIFKINKTGDKRTVKQIKVILYGQIFISIPVIIAFILLFFNNYFLLKIVESIMCKFAFVYAVCLAYFVLNNRKVEDE